jgi:hypothetical protein
MNTALEYSTRVVQEGGRRGKKSTLNDLVHLTPLRIPLMNPSNVCGKEGMNENRMLRHCFLFLHVVTWVPGDESVLESGEPLFHQLIAFALVHNALQHNYVIFRYCY